MSGQWPKPGWSLLSNRSATPVSTAERPVDEDAATGSAADDAATAQAADGTIMAQAADDAGSAPGADSVAATAPAAVDTATAPDYAAPAAMEAAQDDVASQDVPAANQPAMDPVPPTMTAEAPPAAPDQAAAAAPVVAKTEGSEFLAKLARAMHTTAARERTSIADDAERRRQAHVQAIRDRAAVEAERIRQLAAEDMKAIETWAEGEANRIKLEREQRVTAVNEDLELSLAEHGAKIDEEVKAAEVAIAEYRTAVDAYFAGLDRETDPLVIARQASTYPVFPKLPETDGTFSPGADPGPAMVGVMSPAAAGGSLEAAIASVARSPVEAEAPTSEPAVVAVEPIEAPVPVGAPASPSGGAAGQELSALQALLAARAEDRPRSEANGTGPDSQG